MIFQDALLLGAVILVIGVLGAAIYIAFIKLPQEDDWNEPK